MDARPAVCRNMATTGACAYGARCRYQHLAAPVAVGPPAAATTAPTDLLNVCLSGGAEGADLCFGRFAESAGHGVRHYSFAGGHKGVPHVVVLSDAQLAAADPHVARAAKTLKRNAPRQPHVRKLIQRNYYQVCDAERVYAVTRWNQRDRNSTATTVGELGGGTGWAVQMGIDLGVRELYLYAIEYAAWWTWRDGAWVRADAVPRPHGRYAGIGSRDLTAVGERAIRELFEQ